MKEGSNSKTIVASEFLKYVEFQNHDFMLVLQRPVLQRKV